MNFQTSYETAITSRQTKYCNAIRSALQKLGHATNARLLDELRMAYPDVTATTIHRATARLSERDQIGIAPSAQDGSMRYDANSSPHDHFICGTCNEIRDADVIDIVKPALEGSIEGCHIDGRLTISGTCKNCREKRS